MRKGLVWPGAQSQRLLEQLSRICLFTLDRDPFYLYFYLMTQAVAQILEEAEQLSIEERAELADRIVESLARTIPPEMEQAQMTEVRRRIAQVEAGEVTLVPGEEALAHVRRILVPAHAAS